MLTVCLLKLCPKDSLANAFRKVEKYAKIVPPEVGKSPRGGSKMSSWSPPGGSWAPGGPHLAAKAARSILAPWAAPGGPRRRCTRTAKLCKT